MVSFESSFACPPKPGSPRRCLGRHWNGLAVQADNQHWPLIPVRTKQVRHFHRLEISIAKLSHPMAFAERQALARRVYVVQAISICTFTVLPCLAPHDAGQNEAQLALHPPSRPISKTTAPALLRHVPRWIVVIQTIWISLQTSREESGIPLVKIPQRTDSLLARTCVRWRGQTWTR